MKNQKRRKKRNKIVIIILSVFIYISCNESVKKNTADIICNNKNISTVFITNVDIDSCKYVTFKKYKKNDKFSSFINEEKNMIVSKQFDSKLKRWNFNLEDSLNTEYDYELQLNTLNNSSKFLITELEIGNKLYYSEGNNKSYCALNKYRINGVLSVNDENIQLIK